MQLAHGQPAGPLENWLTAQVSASTSSYSSSGIGPCPPIPQSTASERMAALRRIIDGDHSLARAASGLSVYQQMRLTLEVLRADILPAAAVDCVPVRSPLAFIRVAPTQRIPTSATQQFRRRLEH
jgi:hypothetical protein